MTTVSNAVENCLAKLETINDRIRQIQEEHKSLSIELNSLRNADNGGGLTEKPRHQFTNYLIQVLEQYNRPLNMDEVTTFFELHYSAEVPPQVINLKTYLYRYVRKAMAEGLISQHRYSDHNKPYYVLNK